MLPEDALLAGYAAACILVGCKKGTVRAWTVSLLHMLALLAE